ncbi:unnamed protein product [Dibothriocephalus latus]|uniref:Uncharacterized protein n=1 Tax=Dibothriocephalus latus TaxID=60516 RepID=A0A3P7R1C4_DIBLA|nr:unnamed protein product [Dibothriocephalus latus]
MGGVEFNAKSEEKLLVGIMLLAQKFDMIQPALKPKQQEAVKEEEDEDEDEQRTVELSS